tara:strand:+ start:412 stop:1956 length:1545 start_codon:yes stop_codon:yes gene_type:complete
MANTIQIKHSASTGALSPANMNGTGGNNATALGKGELAWVDHGTGGGNGKLYIGDATDGGAVERHIGGVGTGAVSAAAAAGSLTGSTLAGGVTASSLTSVGTIGTGVWQGTAINQTYLTGQSGTNTGDETQSTINALDITEVGTISSGVWSGTALVAGKVPAITSLTGYVAGTYANASSVGGSSIATVGTIGTGTWQGSVIAEAYLQNQSGTNTGDEAAASLTAAGIVELATTGETTTGTDALRAVTPAGVQAAIDALVGGAPGALNTLNELAAAIGDDASYASGITTALALKSTIASPTFTGTVAIPNVANLETAVVANTAKETNVATNLSISGSTAARTIASSDGTDAVIPVATTSVSGVMNPTMFDKLDAIEASATADQSKADINALDITEVGTISSGVWSGTAFVAGKVPAITSLTGYAAGTYANASSTGGSSIVTVGTIGTGTWQGSVIAEAYLQNQSGTNTGDEVAASSTAAGVIELATDAETVTGTATNRAITPANLAASTISGGTF